MRPVGATRDVTRRRVMDAAVELFARRGFVATGIRDIAAAAGLSSSSLYEYISTKDDLLVEIMRSTIQPLIDAGELLADGSPHASRPEWLLAVVTQNHVWFHATHAQQTMVTDTELRALGADHRTEVVALRDRYERVWRGAVSEGARQRVFDVEDADISARSLISLCTGISGWYRPGGRLTIEQLCATHADIALAAVRAGRDGRQVRQRDLAATLPDPASLVRP